jgi:MFS family permease
MFSDLFWALYIIDVVSGLGAVFGLSILGFGCSIAAVLGNRFGYCTDNWGRLRENARPWDAKKWLLIGTLLGAVLGLCVALVPSKKTMYMMLGVKTTENVVESPLGKKLQQIVDAEVDGYLKKLQPNNKE